MATKVKGIKQEGDSKKEAHIKLKDALEASTFEQNMTESEQEEEEMLEDENDEEMDTKKIIKSEHLEENYDHEMDDQEEDEGEFEPAKREIKSIAKQPKPLPQASYIMKLFDRSVNLAKFDEDTPLYPLCRAWMENQPRKAIVKSEKGTDTIIQTVEDGDVVEMPKIRIRKGKQFTRAENKLDLENFDKLIDSEVWTKEKLLEYHRKQWLDIKAKQFESARLFEEKHFTANLQLIDSLQKDADE